MLSFTVFSRHILAKKTPYSLYSGGVLRFFMFNSADLKDVLRDGRKASS